MKKLVLFTLVVSTITSLQTIAINFTQDNVRQTKAIIDATVNAYGGHKKLDSLENLIVNFEVTNVRIGQSRSTNPPWDQNTGDRTSVYDFKNETIAISNNNQVGGGAAFDNKTIIKQQDKFHLDSIRKTVTPLTSGSFAQYAHPGFRSNSTLLVNDLRKRINTARYLGETKLNHQAHHLISFNMTSGAALTLYIDQKTHLVNKSERVVGLFLVEYYFSELKKVDGILFPHDSYYTVDGQISQRFKVKYYQMNQSLERFFEVPESYQKVASEPQNTMATRKLGKGVYWVTNQGQNSLFVEYEDHLLSVGGLPGATERIKEIRKTLPNKPIKYAVLTHHHSDHIGGTKELVKENATIITVKQHQKVIQESLPKNQKAQFEFVDEKKVLRDNSQIVELYDIGPTPHTNHYLLAYLPKQGIIFEADHFSIDATGPLPKRSPNIEALYSAIKARGLKVKLIASAHSQKLATFEDLTSAYNNRG